MSSGGDRTTAMAIATRCRWPPDSSYGSRSSAPCSPLQTHEVECFARQRSGSRRWTASGAIAPSPPLDRRCASRDSTRSWALEKPCRCRGRECLHLVTRSSRSAPRRAGAPRRVADAAAGSSRMIASAVIDFPDPEAPTSPRISPARTSSDRFLMMGVAPIDDAQRFDFQRDCAALMRVTRPSGCRNPSPSRFNPSTNSSTAMPGNRARNGASAVRVCASLSMRPQLGVGGCALKPTYDRPASAMTPRENCMVPCTTSNPSKIRQHVLTGNSQRTLARDAGGQGVVASPQLQRPAARDARKHRDIENADGDDGIDGAGTEHGGDQNRQQQGRKGKYQIVAAHHDLVDRAATRRAKQPSGTPTQTTDDHRQQRHADGGLCALP